MDLVGQKRNNQTAKVKKNRYQKSVLESQNGTSSKHVDCSTTTTTTMTAIAATTTTASTTMSSSTTPSVTTTVLYYCY